MATHRDSESSVLLDFIDQLLDDIGRGSPRTLEEYAARFPGHEEALAAEYERLTRATDDRGGASHPPGADAPEWSPAPAPTPFDLVARLAAAGHGDERYRRLNEVGRGGMGVVHDVWDDDLRRHLAMKILRGEGERRLEHFIEEAQITGRLDHPGIVPVHELGVDSRGHVYFTMRLVRGRTLQHVFDLLREGKEGWTSTRALNVLLKVCEAMAYAHSLGVIHRDLKPANVMVGTFGEVYVMDWGLARVMGRADGHDLRLRTKPEDPNGASEPRRRSQHEGEAAESPVVTMDGDVVGTPCFMAPEQAQGRITELGPHTDVYAVGVLLYVMLTGEKPYIERSSRAAPHTVLAMVLRGPPKPVPSIASDVPAELIAICERAMQRDWRDRYPDIIAMSNDLQAYLEGRVVAAYETGAAAELKKWILRNKGLAAAIGCVLVTAIGGLTLLSFVQANANREIDNTNQHLVIAKANADENARVATQKVDEVLSLAAIEDLQSLIARVARLGPAYPENASKYEEWLRDARALVDGRAADEAQGLRARPGLAAHRSKLAVFRERALPRSEDERARDIAAHPRFDELVRLHRRMDWMARMLGASDSAADDVASDASMAALLNARGVAEEALPKAPLELSFLAYRWVAPDRNVFGREEYGLALARDAFARAEPESKALIRNTVACGFFSLGRFDEALAESAAAAREITGRFRDQIVDAAAQREAAVQEWLSTDGRARHAREYDALREQRRELMAIVAARSTFTFGKEEDDWWHRRLSQLVDDLDAFASDDPRDGTMARIRERLAFAQTVRERSVTGPEVAALWQEAIASIRDETRCPAYRGLVITPQVGLVPIGRDPRSGLWEFAHIQTGAPPARDSSGVLRLSEETGIVLVLIPGDTFAMGSQNKDEHLENYDPQWNAAESPVHDVTLAPYFLSKYEMTQGQWARATSQYPSEWTVTNTFPRFNASAQPFTLLHPVESVSWDQCNATLRFLRLALPTEAQWENGARAGTRTPWWTGEGVQTLQGAANISDKFHKSQYPNTSLAWEPAIDDGYNLHAPVGAGRANDFGLHDVCGNVQEWCADVFGRYEFPVRIGDGLRLMVESRDRAVRGGSYEDLAFAARSAYRGSPTQPAEKLPTVGVRPARALDP